jgi:hypothetical protein
MQRLAAVMSRSKHHAAVGRLLDACSTTLARVTAPLTTLCATTAAFRSLSTLRVDDTLGPGDAPIDGASVVRVLNNCPALTSADLSQMSPDLFTAVWHAPLLTLCMSSGVPLVGPRLVELQLTHVDAATALTIIATSPLLERVSVDPRLVPRSWAVSAESLALYHSRLTVLVGAMIPRPHVRRLAWYNFDTHAVLAFALRCTALEMLTLSSDCHIAEEDADRLRALRPTIVCDLELPLIGDALQHRDLLNRAS